MQQIASLCASTWKQNLKWLLQKRGWGRRPCPAKAMCALFLAVEGLLFYLWRLLTAWLCKERDGHFNGRCSICPYGLALPVGLFQHSEIIGNVYKLDFVQFSDQGHKACTSQVKSVWHFSDIG